MGNNQKDNGNQSGQLSEKKKVGFEKRNPNEDGIDKKQQTPNEEVPNVGDLEKQGPIVAPGNDSTENVNQDDQEVSLGDIVRNNKTEELPEEEVTK